MDRRVVVRSALGGAIAVMLGASTAAAQSTPELSLLKVRSEWSASPESDSGLDKFVTIITAYESEDQAEDAFNSLFDSVQQGTLYNADTQNEAFGDESFFVEYNNMGGLFLIYEGTIRVDNLIYQFRWEAVHYGGARDGHRLFGSVIERAVIKDRYTEDDLRALLPTEEEVAKYGLSERGED